MTNRKLHHIIKKKCGYAKDSYCIIEGGARQGETMPPNIRIAAQISCEDLNDLSDKLKKAGVENSIIVEGKYIRVWLEQGFYHGDSLNPNFH